VCPYGIPPNATHPALCLDGSRTTSNVTCSGINDAATLTGQPTRRCTCFPGYYGADCSLSQDHCDSTVCMGHGHCQIDAISNDIQCVCNVGWATYPPYQLGKQYIWRNKTNSNIGDNLQCQYPAPTALVSTTTGLFTNDQAALAALPCGPYGTPVFLSDGSPVYWFQSQAVTGNFNYGRNYARYQSGFSGACACHMDAYGSQHAATSYCVKQASPWLVGNAAGIGQPCGQPYRGKVIQLTDGFGSSDCFCYNGYGGWDCGTVMCPVNAVGDPCSGPGSITLNPTTGAAIITGRGWCDVASGRCLCAPGAVGKACEIDWKACSNTDGYLGQVVA
jgi:hypothetical protein